MKAENKIVRGLWIGDRLTNIQKLCIKSFQDNGHEFHLFSYSPVEGVPAGTVEINADQIVPWSDRRRFLNDANFSDWFRSNLTYKLGGFYVDMDIVCLQPFDFANPYVFVSEYQHGGQGTNTNISLVNGCLMKVPANDPMTGAIIERIEAMDCLDPNLNWCAVGPHQYRWGVRQFNLTQSVEPPDVFDSLWPLHLKDFVSSTREWHVPKCAHAIHLRTSYWKPGSLLNPDGQYHPDTYFERLKAKHGVKNE